MADPQQPVRQAAAALSTPLAIDPAGRRDVRHPEERGGPGGGLCGGAGLRCAPSAVCCHCRRCRSCCPCLDAQWLAGGLGGAARSCCRGWLYKQGGEPAPPGAASVHSPLCLPPATRRPQHAGGGDARRPERDAALRQGAVPHRQARCCAVLCCPQPPLHWPWPGLACECRPHPLRRPMLWLQGRDLLRELRRCRPDWCAGRAGGHGSQGLHAARRLRLHTNAGPPAAAHRCRTHLLRCSAATCVGGRNRLVAKEFTRAQQEGKSESFEALEARTRGSGEAGLGGGVAAGPPGALASPPGGLLACTCQA